MIEISNASRPRSKHNFQLDTRDDLIAFRRWRRGFFAFYGALLSLLVALAVVADRRETLVGATQVIPMTGTRPISAYTTGYPIESRLRK
jgi:hypothetical protein